MLVRLRDEALAPTRFFWAPNDQASIQSLR